MADDVPAFDDIPSFDDLPDAAGASAPTQQAAVPNFDDIPDFDALPDNSPAGRPAPENAPARAVRNIAHGVPAAVGGYVGAGVGAEIGGTLGLPLGPIGAGVGAVAGGLIGAFGGGFAADKAAQVGLDAIGADDSEQMAANQEAHPTEAALEQAIPAFAGMRFDKGASLVARGVGAAMQGGIDTAQQYANKGHVDPVEALALAAAGAVFPSTNKLGEKFVGVGQRVGRKMVPGRPNDPANPAAARAHADVDDPNVEVDLNSSSLAQPASTDPQPTTGNPQSAPERSARDYGKDKAPAAPENDMLSQGDIAPDTAAALEAAKPEAAPVAPAEPAVSPPVEAPASPVEQPQLTGTAQQNPDGSVSGGDGANGAVFPGRASAINQSKKTLSLKPKLPEPSVEASFPEAGEPVAMGANDVPRFKGETPINDSITDAQKSAGNYPKASTREYGKNIKIETMAGDIRRSKPGEPPWENVQPNHYGDVKETKGADGDNVDYAEPVRGSAHWGDKHFIIDQKNAETGKFDEHKIFGNYKDEAAARDHYEKSFSDGRAADRLGAITEVSRPEMVKVLAKATKVPWTKPYAMKEAKATKKPIAERAVVKDLIAKGKTTPEAIAALPPEQVAAAIEGKRTRKYGVGTGASAGYPVDGVVNAEGKPVTANTKAKAAERSAAHQKVADWFAKSAPKENESNGALLQRITNNGYPSEKGAWVPTHKPAEWLLAREAKKLLAKPTPAAIEKFKEAERMLRGSKEDVDNYRGGNRIEADIARSKRSGDDAVATAEAKNVDNGRNTVEDEMIDAIDAKRTPVNTAADIKAAEKNAGKAIDLNDSSLAKVDTKALDAAGLRKLEAAKLAGKKSAEVNVPSEERAPSEKREIKIVDEKEKERIMAALQAATKKAASRDASLDITAPIEKGAPRARGDLVDMVKQFANDEGGSVDIQKIRDDMRAALKTTEPKTYIAKKSNGWVDDYTRSVSEDLHKINQEDKSHAIGIKQAIEAMPKELDAPMRERMFHARDADSAHVDLPGKVAGKTNIESLPQREQDLYTQHLKPILDQNDQFVANIRAIDPDRIGPDVEHHISRIVKGETDKYNVLSSDDPTSPQYNGIGVNADAAKSRKFYALEDATTGARHVISPTDTGFVKWNKYKREQIKNPGFEFEDGKTLTAGAPGNTHDYIMRQATTKEIEAHARGLDGGKKPMKYYKDAGMAAALPNLQLGSMARHLQELHRLSETPEFGKLTTRNAAKAEERGWKQTNLPNFKGTYMHPDLAHTFDDYAGHPTNALRDFNNWVTKALFWMPTAHINNVGTHWFVGRGFDNVTPAGIKSLLVDTPRAIKSVVNQDAFQRELRSNGAGTVYGGVLTRDMAGQIGKAFQQDVERNPSKWGPIADKLGVPLQDMASAIYRWSSKTMWAANDVFLTQRVMELQRKGMSMKTAIYETEKDIPNYRIPIKVVGSGEKGRMLSRAMQDPIITSFGRYHYGMMNSYANIVKDALGRESTAGDRLQAVGKMMALGLLVTAVYPALDKLAKLVTGNEDASAQRRGPTTIPHHLLAAFQGKEDAAAGLRSTLTLPPLTTSFLETLSNKDFRGKPIVEPGTMERVGKGSVQAAGKALLQEGEHAVRGLVSPFNTLETAAKKDPNQSAAGAAGAALRDQTFDIKNPSQKARKWDRMSHIKGVRDERTRDKGGGAGVLEGLYNKATRN